VTVYRLLGAALARAVTRLDSLTVYDSQGMTALSAGDPLAGNSARAQTLLGFDLLLA